MNSHIVIKHPWMISSCLPAGPNTFDSPSTVAAAMAGSLAGIMDVLSPDSKKKSVYNSHLFCQLVDRVAAYHHVNVIAKLCICKDKENKRSNKLRSTAVKQTVLCVHVCKMRRRPSADPSVWLKSVVWMSTFYWTLQEASQRQTLKNPGRPPLLSSERSVSNATIKRFIHIGILLCLSLVVKPACPPHFPSSWTATRCRWTSTCCHLPVRL